MSNESAIRREIGTVALMFTGLGSIIGSGWLFGAWRATQLAGPGAIYSWVIGAGIILCVAITYAELGAMFPESGGAVRYGHYSHGTLVGFVAGWAAWIAIVSVIPVEAEASVQYMSSWPWDWTHALYVHAANGQGELSVAGLWISAVLVVIYFLVNFWSVKIFANTNSAITFFKLIVPAATAIALVFSGFHWENFQVGIHGGQHVGNVAAILTAVATSGIVFSYNGFQSPVNLAGESKNPSRDVPIAVIGSIVICAIIYVLLQVGFLGAVPAEMLAKAGWSGIQFSSPYAQLALAANINFLAILLYVDAFVSPSGTGSTYTASSSRMLWGMERNGILPKVFGTVHPVYGIPRPAMWLNLVWAFIFFFWFQGWDKGAGVTSVACIISYLMGPVSVAVLRNIAPERQRPLKLPALKWVAGVAFTLATLALYWAQWPLTGEVIGVMLFALPLWFYYEAKAGWPDFEKQMQGAWWLVTYMPTVALLSYIGSTQFGGKGYIPFGWDLLVVAIAGAGFFLWGVKSGWRTLHLEASGETKH